MVYVPNPNEPVGMFEEQIVDNCLTIITRDFGAALAYYYPAEFASGDYPDFDERYLGMPLKETFPCVSVSPLSNLTDEADDRSYIVEAARIRIFIGVTADGPNAVKRKIQKYVRVMNLVLRNARRDFFTGMSNPFGVVLKIEHLYDVERSDETVFFNAAIVDLTVSLCER